MSFRRMEDEGKSGRFSEREINKLERGFAGATAASEVEAEMQKRADEFARGLVADDEGGGDAETNASMVSETREPIAVTPPRVRAALSVGPAGHVKLTLHVRETQRLCAASFGERVRLAEAAAAGRVALAQPRDSAALDSAAGNSAAQRAEMHDPSRPADQAGLRGQRGR